MKPYFIIFACMLCVLGFVKSCESMNKYEEVKNLAKEKESQRIMKEVYPVFMSDCQKTKTYTCCKHDFDYNVLNIYTNRPDFCNNEVVRPSSGGSSVGTGIGVGVGMEIGKALLK